MTSEQHTAPTPAPHTHGMRLRLLAFAVAAVALTSDLATKLWALSALSNGERIPVIGHYLSFVLLRNPGAAFSLGDSVTYIFTIAAFLVTGILILTIMRTTDTYLMFICAFLLGGTLGNLYDRIFSEPGYGRGHVIDFIDYNGYFVGNVADIWIVLAVIAFILHTLTHTRTHD